MLTARFCRLSVMAMMLLGFLACTVFLFDIYRAGTFTGIFYFLFWFYLLFVASLVFLHFQTNAGMEVVGIVFVIFIATALVVHGLSETDALSNLRYMGLGVISCLSVLCYWAWRTEDYTLDTYVMRFSHLVPSVLASLVLLALVYSFNQSVTRLVKVSYNFETTNIHCEDRTVVPFLAGLILERQSILQGVGVITRPSSEEETLNVGRLGLVPFFGSHDTFRWWSKVCGDKYCIDQKLVYIEEGGIYTISLEYRVNRQTLAIGELRMRVAKQEVERTSVCSATLANSSGM